MRWEDIFLCLIEFPFRLKRVMTRKDVSYQNNQGMNEATKKENVERTHIKFKVTGQRDHHHLIWEGRERERVMWRKGAGDRERPWHTDDRKVLKNTRGEKELQHKLYRSSSVWEYKDNVDDHDMWAEENKRTFIEVDTNRKPHDVNGQVMRWSISQPVLMLTIEHVLEVMTHSCGDDSC